MHTHIRMHAHAYMHTSYIHHHINPCMHACVYRNGDECERREATGSAMPYDFLVRVRGIKNRKRRV